MSKKRQVQIQYSSMSAQTKQFLQKICYRTTASVDMTRYGFANDNNPIRLFLNPLRNQLEKIHGKQNQTKIKHRRDKSVDGKRTPGTPGVRGPPSQAETIPTNELDNGIENTIAFLINQHKELNRLIRKKIEESVASENITTKKRHQKAFKAKKLE